jgi:hypothetical protein
VVLKKRIPKNSSRPLESAGFLTALVGSQLFMKLAMEITDIRGSQWVEIELSATEQ